MYSATSLDLKRIDETLSGLVAADLVPVDVSRFMATGYDYVDQLLRQKINIFQYGASHHLLELNHRVLCGTDPETRTLFREHLDETKLWFYGERSGIDHFFDWCKIHSDRPPFAFAAGAFAQSVSSPQLFIEGNRRTATLIAAYCLARVGVPPLVVCAAIFKDFSELANSCSAIRRQSPGAPLSIALVEWRMRRFLRRYADKAFLVRPTQNADFAY